MTPLILVAGFLGAGKTTLLRTLIPRLIEKGFRPHIVLNDYRNADVDAATLATYNAMVSPISGTCVCSGSRDLLMRTLADIELDASSIVLLEANGTADTAELIELISAHELLACYSLPVQIAVVDTKRWQKRFRNRLERLQVQTAGYVQLAHLEQVDGAGLEIVTEDIKQLAPHALLVDANALVDVLASLARNAANFHPGVSPSVPPIRSTRITIITMTIIMSIISPAWKSYYRPRLMESSSSHF